jgi:GNAT superfamily N-acetyltransferase
MNVIYRAAEPTDITAIVNFQIEMAHETEDIELDRDVLGRGVEALFTDPSLGRYFIADIDGKPIASLMITYEWSDWRNGMVWWIQSVYVAPEARRRGIYAGLYQYVKDLVDTESAVRGIRLYVDRRNTAAQEVYRRLGMNGDHYQVFEWMKTF